MKRLIIGLLLTAVVSLSISSEGAFAAPPTITNKPPGDQLMGDHCSIFTWDFDAIGTLPITYEIWSFSGPTIDNNGLWIWDASNIPCHPYSMAIRATNNEGSDEYVWQVTPTDNLPVFSSSAVCGQNFTTAVNTTINFDVSATDPDACDEFITNIISQVPNDYFGSSVWTSPGIISFTPTQADVNRTFTITMGTLPNHDSGNRTYCQFTFTVTQLPTISAEPMVAVTGKNAADPTTGKGKVDYNFLISRYEVTNDEYAAFLNAVAKDSDPNGLYHAQMGADPRCGILRSSGPPYAYSVKNNMGNKPVNQVRWVSALRFCNWKHNGEPIGVQDASTTEDGAYLMNPSPARKDGARAALPTENEWYKAAYYDPDKTTGPGTLYYWDYPTRSNNAPAIATASSIGDISNPGSGIANRGNGAVWNALTGNLTTVGTAGGGSASYSKTYDQGGNLAELIQSSSQRGGSYSDPSVSLSRSSGLTATGNQPWPEVGFRIVSPSISRVFKLKGVSTGVNFAWKVDVSPSSFCENISCPAPAISALPSQFVNGLVNDIWTRRLPSMAVQIHPRRSDWFIISDAGAGSDRVDLFVGPAGSSATCLVGPTGCTFNPTIEEISTCCNIRGDVDDNGVPYELADSVLLADALAANDPSMIPCAGSAEINGDCEITLSDLEHLTSIIHGDSVAVTECSSCSEYDFCADTLSCRPQYACGDADGNGLINISDAIFLINYIFAGGPAPFPEISGDADCNGLVTISDVVYLVNYIFSGGAAPCEACP